MHIGQEGTNTMYSFFANKYRDAKKYLVTYFYLANQNVFGQHTLREENRGLTNYL